MTSAENVDGVVTIVEDNVTQTPDTWNNSLYTALQSISNAAIMPIAIGIMSIILCYELITACLDKNSFKEFDTSIFFRFIVKAWVAIYFMKYPSNPPPTIKTQPSAEIDQRRGFYSY